MGMIATMKIPLRGDLFLLLRGALGNEAIHGRCYTPSQVIARSHRLRRQPHIIISCLPMFQNSIASLPSIGLAKEAVLQKELQLYTVADLIQYYPFRHEDRSQMHKIIDLKYDQQQAHLIGSLHSLQIVGTKNKRRLEAMLQDDTGVIRLVWFHQINYLSTSLKPGMTYAVFGRLNVFNNSYTIAHPEMEPYTSYKNLSKTLIPVYHTTERLKKYHLDSRGFRNIQRSLLTQLPAEIPESLPDYILDRYQLLNKRTTLLQIHFPENGDMLQKAQLRLKFEELFYIQLKLLQTRMLRMEKQLGSVYTNTTLVNQFYETGLPFALTDAQKRVAKEIYADLKSGKQMNRLLQGDVGSGKTIVAFLAMLLVVGSNSQAAMMAPTEILAEQHYHKLLELSANLPLSCELLTGSTPASARKRILTALAAGEIHILIGTHSLLNDEVVFQDLGLTIIDEQHRFGVMQRAKLTQRMTQPLSPHVLIMSATPIPRTLAMTLYGDLDVSTIDQMPAHRKPIKTVHYYDAQRLKVFGFMQKQIEGGAQVYVVYPLIDESETMSYKNLMDGYESISRAFPDISLSIIHGKMRPADKDYEMQRFVKGETKIMIATTVIEVGINVPNANVIVIENANHFGLSQLHQLRGRVGRGISQGYCILMTDYQLGEKSKERLKALITTNDGFEIADMDLRLRGPGDLMGIQQSGALNLKVADLRKDNAILVTAREAAKQVVQADPLLSSPHHAVLKTHISSQNAALDCGNVG